jgi:hypothetical protein
LGVLFENFFDVWFSKGWVCVIQSMGVEDGGFCPKRLS